MSGASPPRCRSIFFRITRIHLYYIAQFLDKLFSFPMLLKPESGTLMVVFVGATSAEHNFTAGNSSQLVSFHKNQKRVSSWTAFVCDPSQTCQRKHNRADAFTKARLFSLTNLWSMKKINHSPNILHVHPHLQIKKNFNSRHYLGTNRPTQRKAIQMGKLLRFVLL